MKRIFVSVCLLLYAITIPLSAQNDEDADQITDIPIGYDSEVSDTITDASFFDLFRFSGSQGEVVVITVTATEGLAPLIGLLNPQREIIGASEEGAPNSRVELELTLPESGEFVINVTRAGRDEGTTTGAYTLLLRRASGGEVQINPLQPVTFRCGVDVVTTVATVEFSQPTDAPLQFEVYGFDDFRPYIRLVLDVQDGFDECSDDSQRMGGISVLLPDGETLTLSGDAPANAASFGVSGIPNVTRVQINIGTADGDAGRYVLVIRGLRVDRAGDEDVLDVRLGPLVAESTTMQVYMVADGPSRIDPYLALFAGDDPDTPTLTCDDAGLRECDNILTMDGAGVTYADGEDSIIGNRFSAGIEIATGDIESVGLRASSRAESATGAYALMIIGEMPVSTASESDD